MSGSLGPLSQEEFKALVEAPYGAAKLAIQKHDPLWGRDEPDPGEKRKWRVTVEAETEEEAEELAQAIPDSQINWDYEDSDPPEVDSVEPI